MVKEVAGGAGGGRCMAKRKKEGRGGMWRRGERREGVWGWWDFQKGSRAFKMGACGVV